MILKSIPKITASLIGTFLLGSTLPANAAGLAGPAAGYNVFVFGNMNQSSDAEGKVAVGGNATFTNFGIGDRLAQTKGNESYLVVGGDLNYNGGQVFGGNAVVGGNNNSKNGPYFDWCPGAGCGLTANSNQLPVDFASANKFYKDFSSELGGLSATGTTNYYSWGGINLQGNSSGLNVFNLDGSKFSNTNSFSIKADAKSTVLVNVTGNVDLKNFGMSLEGGINKQNVLFNFVNATSIKSNGISFQGSVLATNADVQFNNGNLEGNIIANSLQGTGEFHNHLFNGDDLPEFKYQGVPISGTEAGTLLGTFLLFLTKMGWQRRKKCKLENFN